MSRLIVKNLPAYLTQERLREHFASKDGPGGTLTDVKVLQKPDGTSRRFGFVGYKTDAEAEKARKWFDRTFVHSSRISVTVVDGAKDAPTPRPNKRPRLDRHPTEHADSQKAPVSATEKQQDTKSDPQLEEYLEVMQPRAKKGPSWKDGAPEAQTTPSTVSTKSVELPEDPAEALPEPASDADWLKRHMRSSLDIVASSQSAVFDQVEDTVVVDQPEPVCPLFDPHLTFSDPGSAHGHRTFSSRRYSDDDTSNREVVSTQPGLQLYGRGNTVVV